MEYYKSDNGTLYYGDCLEILPQLIQQGIKVDCIITDPPYLIEYCSNYRKVKHKRIINDNNPDFLSEWVDLSFDILKDNRAFYSFCGWQKVDLFKSQIESKFKLKNILIWVKNNTGMGDLKAQYAPKYEMIIYSNKGRKFINGRRDSDILQYSKTNNNLHPTQKPVYLLEYLVTKSTNENDIVLDMFAGSGSTILACEKNNRKWIAIEKDEQYCKTIVEQLKNIQK